MKILLAPMEGLLDHSLRDTLTRVGGIDLCVSEFIRVTDAVLPKRAFYRVVPELLNGGKRMQVCPSRRNCWGRTPTYWQPMLQVWPGSSLQALT